MLEYWRLDTIDGDFFLVRSPSFSASSLVRAYHLELLAKVRGIEDFHLPEYDVPLFEKLRNYYQKIFQLLEPKFECDRLTSFSRHSFFIAAESMDGYWISGLEQLMGYGFSNKNADDAVIITSGTYEVDLLTELLLCIPADLIQYLINNKSSQYLSKLTHQFTRRMRGEEAIKEEQTTRDKALIDKLSEEIKQAGFFYD